MVYEWIFNNLLYWWPQACILCGQSTLRQSLCPACIQDLPRFARSCHRCGLPSQSEVLPCGHCQQQPPAYDRVVAAFAYTTPVAELISQLKFRRRLQLARVFGELLGKRLAAEPALPQAILPVPLHPNRLRSRGYNQALEIARHLSRNLAIPVLQHALMRTRDTAPQSAQSAGQRRRNVRGAFALKTAVPYPHIAIVDDVMTSGHTVSEIARLLRTAGVEKIEVWCVARAWPRN